MRFNIYRISTLVAYIDDEPRVAWRDARAWVRASAHSEGIEGGAGDYAMPGRPGCYERGAYRAVPELRVD